jgi:hypothetical protein
MKTVRPDQIHVIRLQEFACALKKSSAIGQVEQLPGGEVFSSPQDAIRSE